MTTFCKLGATIEKSKSVQVNLTLTTDYCQYVYLSKLVLENKLLIYETDKGMWYRTGGCTTKYVSNETLHNDPNMKVVIKEKNVN